MKMLNYLKRLILLLIITPLLSLAQDNKYKNNDSTLLLITRYITEKNTDSLYALGSKTYQSTTARKSFYSLFENNIYPLGKVKNATFINFQNEISSYKVELDSATLKISFSINKENKLNRLSVTHFVPEPKLKTVMVPTSNPMKSGIDKLVDSAARLYIQKSNTAGLVIGVLKAGKIYTYGYGQTQLPNGKLPDANTVFEIGSITKTLTGEILAYYVNQGKISLTDPITKYLPDSIATNPELQKIKIVNLSNHTSGLSGLPDNFFTKNTDQLNPYKNYTKDLFFASLRNCKLKSVPGETYVYSNQAVGLLGIILERISGKTYEVLVKEIIANPLKMNSTFQHLTPKFAERFVTVYNLSGKETKAWDFDAIAAAGCIRSSLNDLLLYAKSNIKRDHTKLGKAINLSQMLTFSKDPEVGLGWHSFDLKGNQFFWHNGGTGGSRSYLIVSPAKKIAIVVLSNSEASVDAVAADILDKLI